MDYPFVLMTARQRSGTGALGSILGQHPQLKYRGEVFNAENHDATESYFHYIRHAGKTQDQLTLPQHVDDNMDGFIRSSSSSDEIPVLDVKYNSLSALPSVWRGPGEAPFLLNYCQVKGVPIIHLTRKNLIETFVSGELADANKVWHTDNLADIKKRQVTVDMNALLQYLDGCEINDMLMEQWLTYYPHVLTVDYADLFNAEGMVAQEDAVKLSTFLGIEPFKILKPELVKQSPTSARESIANIDDVSAALATTKYAWMLR